MEMRNQGPHSGNNNQSVSNSTEDQLDLLESAERDQIAADATWAEAIGSVIVAIGSFSFLTSEQSNALNIVGNTIQAVANAIIVDTIEEFNLNKTGNILITAGLLEKEIALIFPFNDKSDLLQQLLLLQGNVLRAIGSNLLVVYSFTQQISEASLYGIYGNIIEVIGIYVEIGSNVITIQGRSSAIVNELGFIGNWLQAIGAIIVAIGQSMAADQSRLKWNDSLLYASKDRKPSLYY